MKIVNISRNAILKGTHPKWANSVLIQIADVCGYFVKPKCKETFAEIHEFRFQDTDTRWDDGVITEEQANGIALILVDAKKANRDIIVHCNQGERRSGAVVEVATWIGFEDPKIPRYPNSVVMNMIANKLAGMGEL